MVINSMLIGAQIKIQKIYAYKKKNLKFEIFL